MVLASVLPPSSAFIRSKSIRNVSTGGISGATPGSMPGSELQFVNVRAIAKMAIMVIAVEFLNIEIGFNW